ncbi:MAG: hypothetical protein WD767_00660 [Alphaproteobacteria bacterium]
MASELRTETPAPAAYAETALDRGGRASWGAFFAGTAVALAVSALLTLLGLAIGMSTINPAVEQDPMTGVPAASASAWWTAISAIVALGVGGYVAGRLAGVLHGLGSALHGATVWALTTIVALWLGASAAVGLVNLTGSALSQAWSAVSSAAGAAIPEDFELSDITDMDMQDLPDPVRRAMERAGITTDNFGREMREIFREVVSPQEQERTAELAQETAAEVVMEPSAAGQTIDDMIDDMFGRGGVLSEEDRQEALQVMQERFGVTPQEAEELLQQVEATVQEYRQGAEEALQTAQQRAAEAAGAAADATASAAWGAFFTLLLGLLAAIGGAIAGRPGRPPVRG